MRSRSKHRCAVAVISALAVTLLPVALATAQCAATIDGSTVYTSADATAVRDAVAAASAGDLIKVAGTCSGAVGGKVVEIDRSLTLEGGYSDDNWNEPPDLSVNPTTLDAENGGTVVVVPAGVEVELSKLIITNGASATGGGINALSPLTVTDSVIVNNMTTDYGAGIWADSKLTIIDSTIEGNIAGRDCGGIRSGSSATLTISGASILTNFANIGNGGGICCSGAFVMADTLVSQNTAAGSGAGVFYDGPSLAIRSSEISANQASGAGGGAFLYRFQGGQFTIENTHFSANEGTAGGAVNIDGSPDVTIVQSILADNTATSGGALAGTTTGSVTVLNSTIVDNTSSTPGDVVLGSADSLAALTNTIIVARTGGTAVHCESTDTGAPTFTANNVFAPGGTAYSGDCGDPTGSDGNQSTNPLFIDQAGGDYHLQGISPSIDGGTIGAPGVPVADWDGEPRIVDGDHDGLAVIDQGVDEVEPLVFADGFETGATGKWSNGEANFLVDCGSSVEYLDGEGRTWLADQPWTGIGFGFEGGGSATVTQPIAGTEEDGLYQSERWGTTAYRFDLPPAEYTVTLYLVELGFDQTGGRVFDVTLEGTLVLDDLDLFTAAGDRYVAYPRTFSVAVSDGTLDIGFTDVIDVSTVSAIEIR